MKYILCRMRAEDKIHILFVFTSTKKNDFYNNMVNTKYVMRYNERLGVNFVWYGMTLLCIMRRQAKGSRTVFALLAISDKRTHSCLG